MCYSGFGCGQRASARASDSRLPLLLGPGHADSIKPRTSGQLPAADTQLRRKNGRSSREASKLLRTHHPATGCIDCRCDASQRKSFPFTIVNRKTRVVSYWRHASEDINLGIITHPRGMGGQSRRRDGINQRDSRRLPVSGNGHGVPGRGASRSICIATPGSPSWAVQVCVACKRGLGAPQGGLCNANGRTLIPESRLLTFI